MCRIRPGAMTARGAGNRHAPPDRRDDIVGTDLQAEPGSHRTLPRAALGRGSGERRTARDLHQWLDRRGRPLATSPPYHDAHTRGRRPDLVPDRAHRPRQAPRPRQPATRPSPFGISTMSTTSSIQQAPRSGYDRHIRSGDIGYRRPCDNPESATRGRRGRAADSNHACNQSPTSPTPTTCSRSDGPKPPRPNTALTHAVTEYTERYATARRTHGWTPAEPGELGFPHNRPAAHRTRTHRRRTTPTSPTNPPRRRHPARP